MYNICRAINAACLLLNSPLIPAVIDIFAACVWHTVSCFFYLFCDHNIGFTAVCVCIVARFGRIGRIVCRIGIRNGLDFLAINDPFIEPDYMVIYAPVSDGYLHDCHKLVVLQTSLHRVH